jgi:hypothetical protein
MIVLQFELMFFSFPQASICFFTGCNFFRRNEKRNIGENPNTEDLDFVPPVELLEENVHLP